MPYSIKRPLSDTERAKLSGVPDITAHLLFHRGVIEADSAKRFLEPDYEMDTHDPFLLKDAEKAAERIIKAITNKERIAIYTDYDADGIPGAAIWSDLFKRIGYENFSIYIPHRHDEGFGLNNEAVEQLAGEGVKLLITVDCGVTDVLPVARANELGMEVIITDHHEPPTPLPAAFAIVDHKQIDCQYPDKNLCGSGVAYKLIQAILKKNRFGLKDGHEKWLLDLVGMATLSDMVSLTGENRVFASFGLAVLRKSPRKGLMQLLRKLNIDQRYLTEDDIAFMITPRINAASRMGKPMDAFSLLSADNDTDARFFADHLDKINNERKGVVASIVKEAKKILRERYGSSATNLNELNSNKSEIFVDGANASAARDSILIDDESTILNSSLIGTNLLPKVIVLGNPLWRPSLLGLVANTCAEEFKRPAFFWGRDGDNVIKGSCRSEGKTNVVELMRATPTETFSQFGGHFHSGGFAVGNEEIHYLDERLNKAAKEIQKSKIKNQNETQRSDSRSGNKSKKNGTINSEASTTAVGGDDSITGQEGDFGESASKEIDIELTLESVNSQLHNELNKLAPFGVGNPKPILLFRNIIPLEVRKFGKTGDHVELVFKKLSGEKVSAIAFFGGNAEWLKNTVANKKLDLIASLEKSMYRGRSEIRLRVIDVITEVSPSLD